MLGFGQGSRDILALSLGIGEQGSGGRVNRRVAYLGRDIARGKTRDRTMVRSTRRWWEGKWGSCTNIYICLCNICVHRPTWVRI